MRRPLVLLLTAAAALVPTAASGTWSASATGSTTVSAGTMGNATGFTAACTAKTRNSSVTLSWTVTSDTFVDSYVIARTGAGGGTDAVLSAPRSTSSMTDDPPVGPGISYTYAIRSLSATSTWTTALLAAAGSPTYSRSACTTT